MICDFVYEEIATGDTEPGVEMRVRGNFGQHEKIFLKLQEESPEFRQLYYSRQADLINTTFSCESMVATLDSMIALIRPEMPRHIDRWGRSVNEWERNVRTLRQYIEDRCDHLEDGMTNCYEVTGPYDLTVDIFPRGAGDIDFNTIEIKDFPWTGRYYGGMENLIDADPGPDYDFVRWEVRRGSTLLPDASAENASLILTERDTLVAIFQAEGSTSTHDIADVKDFEVYPNPSSGSITIDYAMKNSGNVEVSILGVMGETIHQYAPEQAEAGINYQKSFDFKELGQVGGTYIVRINTSNGAAYRKVIVVI